jgi:hypothetical protein
MPENFLVSFLVKKRGKKRRLKLKSVPNFQTNNSKNKHKLKEKKKRKKSKKSNLNLLLFVSSSSENQNLQGNKEVWKYKLGRHTKQAIVAKQSSNKARQQWEFQVKPLVLEANKKKKKRWEKQQG